jgi:hypothetical protein
MSGDVADLVETGLESHACYSRLVVFEELGAVAGVEN